MSSEGDGTPGDGALTSSNDSEDNEDSNSKRPHASTSNEDDGNPKKKPKPIEEEPKVPIDDRTLEDIMEDRWLNDKITNEQKEGFVMFLGWKLNMLLRKNHSGSFREVQECININLKHFLLYGEEIKADDARTSTGPNSFRTMKPATEIAFRRSFEDNSTVRSFWEHVGQQETKYDNNPHKSYPFFAIIQSSGYGKSKLMKQLEANSPEDRKVIYLSFANEDAHPEKNVAVFYDSLSKLPRQAAENSFVALFNDAIEGRGNLTLQAVKSEGKTKCFKLTVKLCLFSHAHEAAATTLSQNSGMPTISDNTASKKLPSMKPQNY